MLGDLDELVLQCRNEQARSHIGEAVIAYKAGAYRSAVIMTWVALAFDIVDKLRELSISGDGGAAKKIEEYERIHKQGDIAASLKFERSLLEAARKEFELFSDSELIELERIQEDRNRCAHPSQNMEGEPFSPSAELARAHIRAAIEYVMKNEPAQGRHALDMVMRLVNGDYFPPEKKKAFDALKHSPLMTGRLSLVRAFLVVILKDLLRTDPGSRRRNRYTNCLFFLKEHRPAMWEALFSKEFATLSKTLDVKEHGDRLLYVLIRFKEGWNSLTPGIQAGLEVLVTDLPGDAIVDVDDILALPQLKAAAKKRVKKMTPQDVSHMLLLTVPPEILDHVVESLCTANSYAAANAWVDAFTSVLWADEVALTRAHSERILNAVLTNRQLRECIKLEDVLKYIALRGLGEGDKWDEVLAETGRNPVDYSRPDFGEDKTS